MQKYGGLNEIRYEICFKILSKEKGGGKIDKRLWQKLLNFNNRYVEFILFSIFSMFEIFLIKFKGYVERGNCGC